QLDGGFGAGLDSHPGGVACGEESAGRADECLRGDARHVDARAADLVPFHHDDLPARLGAVHRQRLARLAATDHEQVDVLEVVLTHGVSLSWSARATSGCGGPTCGAWAARLRRGSDCFGVVLAPVPEVRSTAP